MRYVELRRHTDNDGDRLTPRGTAEAEAIGRDRLHPPYASFVSSGTVRATRSSMEDRWRDAGVAAGKDADLNAILAIDPDLIRQESVLLASALRHVVDRLLEGGRALVVGYSRSHEAACWGSPAGSSAAEQGRGSATDRGRW
jgi:hypothetical protein